MAKKVTLSAYVKRRNGVPLGASGSMSNMLKRSLGANSFAGFWHYWNPVWSYYLSRNVLRPLSQFMPMWLAIITTFAISGALHDVAVTILKWRLTFFLTPWFTLMGIMVLLSKRFNLNYGHYQWSYRAALNFGIIAVTLAVTFAVTLIVSRQIY